MGAPDPGVGVAVSVGVGPVEVSVGVGVFGFGALGLLALAEPPAMLNINASTTTAVRIMNRGFCFFMTIFLSVTFRDRLYQKQFDNLRAFASLTVDPETEFDLSSSFNSHFWLRFYSFLIV